MQKVPTGGEDEKIRVAISDIWSEGFLGSGCNPGCGAHKLQRKLFIFYFHPPSLCNSLSLSLSRSLLCSFYENILAVDHCRGRGVSIVTKVNMSDKSVLTPGALPKPGQGKGGGAVRVRGRNKC